MNLKILNISSMYPEHIDQFYRTYPFIKNSSYNEISIKLLEDSTEFVASYTRTFNRMGVEANCIITNDHFLNNKWKSENNCNSRIGKELIFEQIKKISPDVLWIDYLGYIDYDWIQKIRNEIKSVKLVMAYHCAPSNPTIIRKLQGVDFLITCTPGIRCDFEKYGIKSYLVYHGFDTEILTKLSNSEANKSSNFIFSGSLFLGIDSQGGRLELIEKILSENIDLKLYVNLEKECKIRAKQSIYFFNQILKKFRINNFTKRFPIFEDGETLIKNYSKTLKQKKREPVFGLEMYNLLKNSNITLNVHGDGAKNFAGNMRLFEATGVGSCLLTDKKDNLHELFDINNEIVVYDGIDDCIEKIRWLLNNDEKRKQIALAGQHRTLKTHTVEDRCKRILEIINDELKIQGFNNT